MQYRQRRKVTDFSTRLRTELGLRRAYIADATDEGVKVRLEMGNLEPETVLDMLVDDRAYPAVVVWAKDGEAGLQFKSPLPPNIAALIKRESRSHRGGKKTRFVMR